MDKKIIFGALVLGGLFMMSSNSSTSTGSGDGGGGADPCPKYFNVSGSRTCETLLPDLGFVYWKGGAHGDGWYSYSQFLNAFGIPQASWEAAVRASATQSLDPTKPIYANAQNLLGGAYRGTAGPLTQMS